ncbi:MAG TPA: DUF2007 domain-containing protein [Candidatus Kryptonia bacterium]
MKANSSNIPPGFVRVYYTFVPANIMLAKMILDREGIEYFTRGETWAGVYPGADGMATVDFLVKDEDVSDAKKVLKDLIEGNH